MTPSFPLVPSAAERVSPRAGTHPAHPGRDAPQAPASQPQPAAQAQLQRGPRTQLRYQWDQGLGMGAAGIKWPRQASPDPPFCTSLVRFLYQSLT